MTDVICNECAVSLCAASQMVLNQKTRQRKLRSGVNCKGALQQKCVEQTDIKQGLPVRKNDNVD